MDNYWEGGDYRHGCRVDIDRSLFGWRTFLDISKYSAEIYQYIVPSSCSLKFLNDSHFTTVITSFGRSPKLGWYLLTLMPRFSLRLRRSHLFKNKMSCVFANSFEEQIDVHRVIESSKRFTLLSSSKRWSKTDTGDTESRSARLSS